MLDIMAWSGRFYVACALLLVGAGLVLTGLAYVPRRGRQPRAWLAWAFVYLYGFRRVVVGICLVAAGVAWIEQVPWLLAASTCIGVGELVESTYYIVVLRWGRRRLGMSTSG